MQCSGRTSTIRSTSLSGFNPRPWPSCPGCPPDFCPVGSFAGRGRALGGSEDGGLEELRDVWFDMIGSLPITKPLLRLSHAPHLCGYLLCFPRHLFAIFFSCPATSFHANLGSAIQVMLSPEMSQKSPVDSAYCRLTFARQPYLDSTTIF